MVGGIGLYRSFAIGPVRLVAPIVGAYPILSVGWAAVSGAPVPLQDWLAVLMIVAGVGIVAILSDEGAGSHRRRDAILWAMLGAAGFAATFALGQAATASGAELPVILMTRFAAIGAAALIALALATSLRPPRRAVPILMAMGLLDAVALGLVIAAGTLPNPEYAAVTSSVFGVVTILLAWAILRERVTLPQWAGVAVVFGGIGWLGI